MEENNPNEHMRGLLNKERQGDRVALEKAANPQTPKKKELSKEKN